MSRPFERRASSPTHDACVATARVSLPAFARKKARCLRNDSPNVMVNAYDHRTAHSHEENCACRVHLSVVLAHRLMTRA
jgi:hypothetical protein